MSSSSKKITLKSSDGESFEVEETVALESQILKYVIEDVCTGDKGIPLPNVTGKILAKVIEYCKMHIDAANPDEKISEDDLKAWDQEFVKVDGATLFDLMHAAHYLNIKSLLELTCLTFADMIKGLNGRAAHRLIIESRLAETCQTVADMIKNKTLRKTFNIKKHFTPQEVEEIRRENQWVLDFWFALLCGLE